MIAVEVEVPYGSFRKSFARGYGESYPLPPPATVYGMLLSLVGERFRSEHEGVRLAFAYKCQPNVATTLRKLSRFKYGVADKQEKLGNQPDYIETLCGIHFICFVDSTQEKVRSKTLESRIRDSIVAPEMVERYGVLALGLSDDAVDSVTLCEEVEGKWLRLMPSDTGVMELPIWVDHVGSQNTRWQRYWLDETPTLVKNGPIENWDWTSISRN